MLKSASISCPINSRDPRNLKSGALFPASTKIPANCPKSLLVFCGIAPAPLHKQTYIYSSEHEL